MPFLTCYKINTIFLPSEYLNLSYILLKSLKLEISNFICLNV